MAKRKRLTPANPAFLPEEAAPETKGMFPSYPDGVWKPPARKAPPIAGQAAESAAVAALEEVSGTLEKARAEGRLVVSVPLSQIDIGHLVRDRVAQDDEETTALIESLRARGQQTPVEVTPLADGRYGLISGWRRCQALRQIHGEAAEVLALVRQPDGASDAYIAMVEENEIRVGLSFYERARIVAKTLENRVYSSEKEALHALFGNVPRARRSKIKSFIGVVRALDGALLYPQSLSERAGLALAKALELEPALAGQITTALEVKRPTSADQEQEVIGAVLNAAAPKQPAKQPVTESVSAAEVLPGLQVKQTRGKLVLQGPALTPQLQDRLLAWLQEQT